jgi:hypothetical protein
MARKRCVLNAVDLTNPLTGHKNHRVTFGAGYLFVPEDDFLQPGGLLSHRLINHNGTVFALEVMAQRDTNKWATRSFSHLEELVNFAPGRTCQLETGLHRVPPDRNRKSTSGKSVFQFYSKYSYIWGVDQHQTRLESKTFSVCIRLKSTMGVTLAGAVSYVECPGKRRAGELGAPRMASRNVAVVGSGVVDAAARVGWALVGPGVVVEPWAGQL